MKFKKNVALNIVGGILGFTSINVNAASSLLLFDNASGLGNNYSGIAAIADDASTLYFNPAGLSRIRCPQVVVGDIEARFNGTFTGSDTFLSPFPFNPITQSGFVNGIQTIAPFPFFYFSQPITNQLTAGIGIFTPFGIGMGAPDNSIVRYSGYRIVMFVIDVSPAISYRITQQLSIGLGADLQRQYFKTAQMVPNFSNPNADFRIVNTATGRGYGWHAGLLYEFTPCTRAGLTYHSQTNITPSGQSEFEFNPGSNLGTEIVSNNFKFHSILPASIDLSFYQDVTPQWSWMGTVDWQQWSAVQQTVFQNIASFNFIPPATVVPTQINGPLNQNYSDTWRVALGTHYKFNRKWMGRVGVAYETDPTDSNVRPLTDPGTGSTSIALGAHYQPVRNVGVDAGYAHYFIRNSSINNVINGPNFENGTVALQRDAVGLQLTWDFV